MKLKTQETIRTIELITVLSSTIISNLLSQNIDIEQSKQLIELLSELSYFTQGIYSIDVLANYRTQTLTEEHRKMKMLYENIIKNTKEFYSGIGLKNPVEIFAMYVYMYRKGYFSHDKRFVYSSDMKDFSRLLGVDVIRGKGVCRSISSMLTDIYREMGLNSYNLYVKTDTETILQLEHLCSEALPKEESSKHLVKIVMLLTKFIPIGNHLITMTEYEGQGYKLDPTNDGMLYKGVERKLLLANNPNYHMKNYPLYPLFYSILGMLNEGFDLRNQSKMLNLPSISDSEYRTIYLNTLKICLENEDLFEQFYQTNKEIIDEIYGISKEQNDLIRRLIPIIPKKKK